MWFSNAAFVDMIASLQIIFFISFFTMSLFGVSWALP